MNCDLCNKPVEPGQPRYGLKGDGGKGGPTMAFDRHYDCHSDRFGKPLAAYTPQRRVAEEVAARPARKAIKQPKVTKGEFNRSFNAQREWKTTGAVRSEVGKRRIEIECPFCNATFWAYVWSLAGGGKKCPNCGAKHGSTGQAIPLEGNEEL